MAFIGHVLKHHGELDKNNHGELDKNTHCKIGIKQNGNSGRH